MKALTNITPAHALSAYTHAARRVFEGRYTQRTAEQRDSGSFPADGIEETLDALVAWASAKGLVFRRVRDTEEPVYSLMPIPVKQVWQSADTTWNVLAVYYTGDMEMWHCRVISPEHPEGQIAECAAKTVQGMATRKDEGKS